MFIPSAHEQKTGKPDNPGHDGVGLLCFLEHTVCVFNSHLQQLDCAAGMTTLYCRASAAFRCLFSSPGNPAIDRLPAAHRRL